MAEPKIGEDGWYDDWPEWAKNELSEGARMIPWSQMDIPAELSTTERSRSYIQWMKLTHNGRRSPMEPKCSECGVEMTEAEKDEFYAAMEARSPAPAVVASPTPDGSGGSQQPPE